MIDLDALDANADALDPVTLPPVKRTPVLDRLERAHRDNPPTRFRNPATPKMIGYVMVLLRKLDDHNPDVAAVAREWWMRHAIMEGDDTGRVIGSNLSFDQVREVIEKLKGHLDADPVASSVVVVPEPSNDTRSALHDVLDGLPEARYALPVLDDAGNPVGDKHRYFKIKLSKRSGRPYLVEGHGGGNGDLVWDGLVKFEDGALTIARRLAEDPHKFIVLFGEKTSHCGDCGRSLSNEDSRRIGIGPYCRGKSVWKGTPWYDGPAEEPALVDFTGPLPDDISTPGTTVNQSATSGRIDHSACDHPRTAAGRAACRANRKS